MRYRHPELVAAFGERAIASMIEEGVCFTKRRIGPDWCYLSVRGCCVVGELFCRSEHFPHAWAGMPGLSQAMRRLGGPAENPSIDRQLRARLRDIVGELITLNDKGKLQEPDEVRRAFLSEE